MNIQLAVRKVLVVLGGGTFWRNLIGWSVPLGQAVSLFRYFLYEQELKLARFMPYVATNHNAFPVGCYAFPVVLKSTLLGLWVKINPLLPCVAFGCHILLEYKGKQFADNLCRLIENVLSTSKYLSGHYVVQLFYFFAFFGYVKL